MAEALGSLDMDMIIENDLGFLLIGAVWMDGWTDKYTNQQMALGGVRAGVIGFGFLQFWYYRLFLIETKIPSRPGVSFALHSNAFYFLHLQNRQNYLFVVFKLVPRNASMPADHLIGVTASTHVLPRLCSLNFYAGSNSLTATLG